MPTSTTYTQGRCHDPERLVGIPLLASFIATNDDASIFRKFARLGSRNLLHLQNHLNELEARLDEFDKKDAAEAEGNPVLRKSARSYELLREAALEYERMHEASPVSANGTNGMLRSAEEIQVLTDCYERFKLHEEITAALQVYRQALIEEHQIQAISKPSHRALTTFKKYFTDGGNILIGNDKKILQHEEDLIGLSSPSEDDRLSRFVRYSCGYCLQSRKSKVSKRHPEIFFFPPRRVQIVSYSITAILCGVLLVGAMACLSTLNDRSMKLRIGMVALFTFLFAGFVALLTNARRAEVFGSTAAYAAVLVVYVSVGVGGTGRSDDGAKG